MRYPTDDVPVRPGTSDALTARTIDATVHPPLVRAQETVAALGPRIAQSVVPLTSPLFLGLVAITLMFVLVARRLRYRPSALVLSALLVMGLTSFRPLQKWEQPKRASVRPRTVSRAMRPHYWNAVPALASPAGCGPCRRRTARRRLGTRPWCRPPRPVGHQRPRARLLRAPPGPHRLPVGGRVGVQHRCRPVGGRRPARTLVPAVPLPIISPG